MFISNLCEWIVNYWLHVITGTNVYLMSIIVVKFFYRIQSTILVSMSGIRFLGGKEKFLELTVVAVGWFIDLVGS